MLNLKGMKNLRQLIFGTFVAVCSLTCSLACIWDATTLEEEKSRRRELAEVILGVPIEDCVI
jgi:hypothetical protein